MLTLTVLYIGLGCVSAENLDDTNSTIVSIDDNSQLNEINLDYADLKSSNIEEESKLENAGDYVQIKDHKTGQTGTITTSDSSVSLDMTWSGAGGTTLYLYVDGVETTNSYSIGLFENYGSADSVFTYNFAKEGTYVLKVDTGSHIYESNHITYIYNNGGSQGNGTGPAEDSASISIYDMAYPGQSTIVSNGDYVSDIAYSITKSGDGFTDENLDVIVNGLKIGSTTPKLSNRLGNLTFTEDNEWTLTVIYTATVNGKTVTATSNNLTFITRNTSGGNSSGNGTEDENGTATISIYDVSYPDLTTITSEGDYTARIAYNIFKSGDGFSDESLDVIVNGQSIGVTTPNSANQLGNITINEDNEWVVYVIYTASYNGKTVTATSNNLTFITRNTSGGNSSGNGTGNNTNGSGENPEPQPGEMQLIIRDSNNPNFAVINLNDKYNVLIEYYVTVPSGDLLVNDLVIYCNGNSLTSINPVDKTFTSIGGSILINETGDYVFTAKYNYYIFMGEQGSIDSNSITYHVEINNQSQTVDDETLSISVSDVFYPNEVTATVCSSVDGVYTVTVGGNSKDVTVSGGVGSVNFALPADSYTATVESKSNSSFRNSTTFRVLSIDKTTPQISINAMIDRNMVNIIITLPLDINENVTLTLNNQNPIEVKLSNGFANVELGSLDEGDYSYTVFYKGNEKYNGVSDTKTFTISNETSDNPPVTQSLTITVSDVSYPDEAVVIVKSSIDGIYIVTVSNTSKEVIVGGGIGTTAFFLSSDNYTAEVVSKTNSTFKNATSFKVLKADVDENSAVDINVPANSSSLTFSINLANATGTFTVTVDNNPISKSLVDGKASITLNNLADGNHTIVIQYSGDDNYGPIKKITSLYVNNTVIVIDNGTNSNNSYNASTIDADDLTRAQNSPYDFKATFYDKDGKLLQNADMIFIVNGNDYTVKTDEYGVAKLVGVLAAGSYEIQIKNLESGETLNKTVKIVKRITGNENINVDYTFSATYRIRVYADNGNVAGANEAVSITLNNVVHTTYTDSNGYVSFKISGLLAKTYKITAEYKGVKVSNNVVVKKLVLKAKNAKFKKAKKVKKYKVSLKTSTGKAVAGKQIFLKVKGKTYKAKTNAKGVATFKIKNLKRIGKFKATISYQKLSVKKTIRIKR